MEADEKSIRRTCGGTFLLIHLNPEKSSPEGTLQFINNGNKEETGENGSWLFPEEKVSFITRVENILIKAKSI